MRFIDLFAGIGGFHAALSEMGGECVLACEYDKDCQKVYLKKYPNTNLVSNIREITRIDIDDENSLKSPQEISELVPDHDFLCAGFPCQPFSKSGKQKGVTDKARGTLFFDIMQIIQAKHPKYVLLENVRNLAGPRHKETWSVIVASLREEGYLVSEIPSILTPHLIPKKLGGAPQVRDRVFIAAEHNGSGDPLLLKRDAHKENHSPDSWNISEYLQTDKEISVTRDILEYRLKNEEMSWVDAWDYFVMNIEQEELPGFPIWVDAFLEKSQITSDMPKWKKEFLTKNSIFYCHNKKFIKSWLAMKWGVNKISINDFPPTRQMFEWQARKQFPNTKNRTLKSLVMQMRPSGIRVKPATYLPALVAITQTSIVGPLTHEGIEKFRRITPFEAAGLQGLDGKMFAKAEVTDKVAYKQLGNSVNVGVVKYVANKLVDRSDLEIQLKLDL